MTRFNVYALVLLIAALAYGSYRACNSAAHWFGARIEVAAQ